MGYALATRARTKNVTPCTAALHIARYQAAAEPMAAPYPALPAAIGSRQMAGRRGLHGCKSVAAHMPQQHPSSHSCAAIYHIPDLELFRTIFSPLTLTAPLCSPGGGRGITPACPSSRATVAEGCAPTDSQYLRQQEQWPGKLVM